MRPQLRVENHFYGVIVMAKKMTKAAGRRRLAEIDSKMMNLYASGYVSMKDIESVRRIVKSRTTQLK
jgi:hypothetical protein